VTAHHLQLTSWGSICSLIYCVDGVLAGDSLSRFCTEEESEWATLICSVGTVKFGEMKPVFHAVVPIQTSFLLKTSHFW